VLNEVGFALALGKDPGRLRDHLGTELRASEGSSKQTDFTGSSTSTDTGWTPTINPRQREAKAITTMWQLMGGRWSGSPGEPRSAQRAAGLFAAGFFPRGCFFGRSVAFAIQAAKAGEESSTR
jgi:hypothetical protein